MSHMTICGNVVSCSESKTSLELCAMYAGKKSVSDIVSLLM